jgi:hypothetical protein
MCEFKPGDEVVCVNASLIEPAPWQGDAPVEGGVYVVVAVHLYRNEPHVRLAEISNVEGDDLEDVGYRARRFRKVQKRDLTAWLSDEQTFEEPKRAPAKKRERV